MNLPKFTKLSTASQLSLLAVVVLVGAVFFTVNSAIQQKTNVSSRASTGGGSTITIYAAGTPVQGVYPTMVLLINNVAVKTWTNVQGIIAYRTFLQYTYTSSSTVTANQVKIQFTNDATADSGAEDRNLYIDKINIAGVDYQTESPYTYRKAGTYAGYCRCEVLPWNGYFQYSSNGGPTPTPTSTPAATHTPTPTSTPAVTDTPTPTLVPTVTLVPTATPIPGNTILSLNLLLHGIGNGGDNANPNSQGNFTLQHPERTASVEVYDNQNQLVATPEGTVVFDNANGNFTGLVDLGGTFTSGFYTIKVKLDQYLRTIVPGIQSITAQQINTLPATAMVTGDINNDNAVNILDYNILMGCYSDLLPAQNCTDETKVASDLNDDGAVNQFDYNLFVRELVNRGGQ